MTSRRYARGASSELISSFPAPSQAAVSYPFERSNASQAVIDGLALLFGFLFLSLLATAFGAACFILISFH